MDVSALDALRGEMLFKSWEGLVPDSQLDATRDVFDELLDRLVALGPDASEQELAEQFQESVQRLSELDADEQFISPVERDELCNKLYELGGHCGMPDEEAWIDEWRDW